MTIKYYEFVEKELEYFRRECNFTEDELAYFNYRAKNKSNVQISLLMHISEAQVSKLAKRVKIKILKVI